MTLLAVVVSCKKDKEDSPVKQPENQPDTLYENPYFNPNLEYGSVTDLDGNVYATIQIGEQVWMAENLRTTKYNDGVSIPYVSDNDAWEALNSGAYSINQGLSAYEMIYGKLYNWYAVNTGKLCPIGWHIPSQEECEELRTYLADNWLGNHAGGKMKSTGNTSDQTGLWFAPNEGATNESGFTGLPGGRSGNRDIGRFGHWWTSTETSAGPWSISLYFENDDLDGYYETSRTPGFSCRCVQD